MKHSITAFSMYGNSYHVLRNPPLWVDLPKEISRSDSLLSNANDSLPAYFKT